VYFVSSGYFRIARHPTQADELDLVSVNRSMDSSMSKSAISRKLRTSPGDIAVFRYESINLDARFRIDRLKQCEVRISSESSGVLKISPKSGLHSR
jgi:hypothetical protein